MDSAAPRWLVRVEIDEGWELVQAQLLDFPVEAVVEGDVEARVYFRTFEDASAFARAAAPDEIPEQECGDSGAPALVFGGGDHPTTALCLRLMDGLALDGRRVADVGSGTGVLAAYAMKRGARVRAAVDIDAPAAAATQASTGVAVQGGPDCLAAGAFDVVLANLHLAALRAVWPELERLGAPVMVISGLLSGQAEETETLALAQGGWRCQTRQESEGWVCFVFSRPAGA